MRGGYGPSDADAASEKSAKRAKLLENKKLPKSTTAVFPRSDIFSKTVAVSRQALPQRLSKKIGWALPRASLTGPPPPLAIRGRRPNCILENAQNLNFYTFREEELLILIIHPEWKFTHCWGESMPTYMPPTIQVDRRWYRTAGNAGSYDTSLYSVVAYTAVCLRMRCNVASGIYDLPQFRICYFFLFLYRIRGKPAQGNCMFSQFLDKKNI